MKRSIPIIVAVSTTLLSTLLTLVVAADDFCGRLAFGPHHPYEMSYGMLWNYIDEFQNPKLSKNLRQSLHGNEISVGVWFNEQGVATGCGGQVIVRKPNEKANNISQHLQKSIAELLCHSIMTWRFRPLIYCSKAVPVSGPIVFRVDERKLVLIEVTDPRFRKGGRPPIERKAD